MSFREIISEERPAFFNIRSVLTVNRKTAGLLSLLSLVVPHDKETFRLS